MSKKKHKCDCPPEGAPAWVLTFGDMMSLLLTFFIMLVAMSEIKKEDEWRAITEAVKKSFGMKIGGGSMPTEEDPALQAVKILEEIESRNHQHEERSRDTEEGPDGTDNKVTKPRESMEFVIGGVVTFEPGSSELTITGQRVIDDLATVIKGHKNKIEVHGHTSSMEPLEKEGYSDLWELSMARARVVERYITSEKIGIDKARIRLVANADNEKKAHRLYDPTSQRTNQRVEIIVTDAIVDDFNAPEMMNQ